MVPTVAWMRKYFDFFNKKYFEGKLPIPQLLARPLNNVWGRWDMFVKYDRNGNIYYKEDGNGKISLTTLYSRDERDLMCTLLHEMIHEYIFLVLKKCPNPAHGKLFMNIGRRMAADGFNIEDETYEKKTDIFNGKDKITPSLLCVIEKNKASSYLFWVCKADANNINAYRASASKIPDVKSVQFFKILSPGLLHVDCNPQNLFGWGGKSYKEAISNMMEYTGDNQNVLKTMEKVA